MVQMTVQEVVSRSWVNMSCNPDALLMSPATLDAIQLATPGFVWGPSPLIRSKSGYRVLGIPVKFSVEMPDGTVWPVWDLPHMARDGR